ncbi:hypothetical protein [Streptomyces sp900116325]|uniref:hypothetical protein n=1 Tax=Streptomyces sp. 900116325 TaxID=3154295 RepID=UPI003332C9E4
MPEGIDPTHLDEALRRSRTELDTDTRALLLAIADRLSTVRADKDMREVTRLASALRAATDRHGFDTSTANAAEQLLLRHMPGVENRTISRGEYALLLRARAGRDTSQAERVADLHRLADADYAQNLALRRRDDYRDDANTQALADGSHAARSLTT